MLLEAETSVFQLYIRRFTNSHQKSLTTDLANDALSCFIGLQLRLGLFAAIGFGITLTFLLSPLTLLDNFLSRITYRAPLPMSCEGSFA